MKAKEETEIDVGCVVYLKSDTKFNLPMIVKIMPDVNYPEAFLCWIGSQKTVVKGHFPLNALVTKPIEKQ